MSSQSNREFSIDYSQDPRKVFVNFLLWNIKEIEGQIYFSSGRSRQATRLLTGLIDSLDQNSKEKLKDQYERLTLMKAPLPGDLEQLYRDIMTYLHQTYLQEFIHVRPLNPHPKHIGMEQDGKSPTV